MIKAIIFDIDGVLLDSFEANLEFFQNLMRTADYQSPTRDQYTSLFHRTLRDTVKILTKVDDEKEIERITALIDEVDSPPPIITEGAPDIIKELSKKYLLGVVTSRIKAYAYEPPLNSLEHYFKTTIAYEDTENHKPHPEPLLLAARQLNILPEESVYVGDAKSDMDAAEAAGMKFILFAESAIEGATLWTSAFKHIPKIIDEIT